MMGCHSLRCEEMQSSWRLKCQLVWCVVRGRCAVCTKLDFQRKHIWTIPHLGGARDLHTHQISWKYLYRGRCIPLKEIIRLFSSGIQIQFQFWQLSALEDLPVYHCTKFQENWSTHGWVIVIQLYCYIPLNLHCQRHDSVVQALRPSLFTASTTTTELLIDQAV